MEIKFCPKCGFTLETEYPLQAKKGGIQLGSFMECKNCKTHFDTPTTRDKEEWKKKTN